MNIRVKKLINEYAYIISGTFILAVSLNVFLIPNKISGGGVSTLATVLFHLFGVKVSVTNLLCNAVLFALGHRYLGAGTVVKTVAGILFLSLFLEITSYFPVYRDDLFAATVLGGVIMGAGVGFVIKKNASTGGSDFAALILKRFFPHMSAAKFILFIDCFIVILSGIVFRSFTITVYSVIAIYISALVTDYIAVMGDDAKTIFVRSAHNREIADIILSKFERGVTELDCRGMYTGEKGTMLYCVVSPKELPRVIGIIRDIDRNAFVVVNEAKEVLGEGFKDI